jgi:hypothetical protein
MTKFSWLSQTNRPTISLAIFLALASAANQTASHAASAYRLSRTQVIAQAPLQGTVRESNLQAEAQLREMESTSAYLKRAATDMITEVEQANFYLSNEPGEAGLLSTPTTADLLPPKRKWVTYVMKELADLIPIMHADISTVVIPDEKLPVVGPTMKQIQIAMDAVDASYKNLQTATQASKLDNLTIGRSALNIHDNVTKIEDLERQALRQLKEIPDQSAAK